ncbi:hypothetical protein QZH41_003869 [Actinostola sp. cb2023]|nr:hypothetical protein QZH41_003869 [Actinostola sp. cb2023]
MYRPIAARSVPDQELPAKPDPPKITSKLNRTVIGYRGNSVSFVIKTQFTTKRYTAYDWLLDGRVLQSGLKFNISEPRFKDPYYGVFRMTVNNLSEEDTGIYQLLVTTNNPPGAEDYVNLIVLEPGINPEEKEIPKFDLFISYTSKDFEWVSKRLVPLLEKHKAVYSIHSKDFEIGKTIVDNMADSVYTCKHVVAVVSEMYLESKFCCVELDMAVGRTFLTKKPRLSIIALDALPAKKLHKHLKGIVYIQNVAKDEENAWGDELMKHLLPFIKEKQVI